MKPPVDSIRVGRRGREQLTKLRRATAIENYNILCRWAICASLREPSAPPPVKGDLDGGVEMSWKVFAGEHSGVYIALLAMRRADDLKRGNKWDEAEHFRRHLHRGLNFLDAKLESFEGHELLSALALGKRGS
ncbi:MAG TPA: DNA sulfur modification protein DndE [Bryobacteraceae bacterium]|nr:DNA sulfur modification protein DndE [Bryobacteraceae bacterium]